MKRKLILAACVLAAGVSLAAADPAISSAQKALKDQGFYYGEVNGQKNAETSAAIRRFQIRNGLKISGELDAETARALGTAAGASSAPKPSPKPLASVRPLATPRPVAIPKATPVQAADKSDNALIREAGQEPGTAPTARRELPPEGAYIPGPRGLRPETGGFFDGTPYEVAPPDLQRQVVMGAQVGLARRGYYRGRPDGSFGPGTALALRAFQARQGIEPTGQLDMETLAMLGLLPGQQTSGSSALPQRRVWRHHGGPLPPVRGEWIRE